MKLTGGQTDCRPGGLRVVIIIDILSSDSVAVFKLRLKTFLFSQAFSSFSAH